MGFVLYRTDDDIKELWNDFSDVIYPLCCSYMPDALSADEALVKVFIDAMKHEKDFENDDEAKKWLILRTDYVCKNMFRQWWTSDSNYLILDNGEFFEADNFDTHEESDTDDNHDDSSIDDSFNTDEGINKYPFVNESVDITSEMKSIIKLPDKYKLIIYLYFHEALSTKEISDYINLSQQLVRSRLHDAKLLLNDKQNFESGSNIYKNAYDKVILSEDKKNYLLELVIDKAHDEEFYSHIIPKEEEEIYANNVFLPKDYDDKAESIAILKANLPKLIPGAICLIAIIVIMIMYFLKNSM